MISTKEAINLIIDILNTTLKEGNHESIEQVNLVKSWLLGYADKIRSKIQDKEHLMRKAKLFLQNYIETALGIYKTINPFDLYPKIVGFFFEEQPPAKTKLGLWWFRNKKFILSCLLLIVVLISLILRLTLG